MGTQLPFPKGAQPPIFGQYLLRPNGWMPFGRKAGLDPSDIVLYGNPASPPQKGDRPPIFVPRLLWPNGWMDQDPLGVEVGLGLGHIVLRGDPAPLLKKGE